MMNRIESIAAVGGWEECLSQCSQKSRVHRMKEEEASQHCSNGGQLGTMLALVMLMASDYR